MMHCSRLQKLFLIMVCTLSAVCAQSQLLDSLQVEVGSNLTGATKSYQPFWITTNRFGVIADTQFSAASYLSLQNKHLLREGLGDEGEPGQPAYNSLWLGYGLQAYHHLHSGKVFFKEGFAYLGYKQWRLAAGRFEDRLSMLDPGLSLGSFGLSGNALPIPKVQLAATEYVPVPETGKWIRFKGSFAHGWFGNNRYMQDAFYHGKSFYLRFGGDVFGIYGGLEHYAEWGGRRGKKQLERSWKGFWDVAMVKEADDGSVGTAINGILPSRAGDQRGLLGGGFDWDREQSFWNGYFQMPFESGEEVDPRNRSVLAGLSYARKEPIVLKKVLVELLYTKKMNDFVIGRQRQSYYNNGYYRTGWEYNDRVIGMPLFTNRVRANKYFPAIIPFDWSNKDTTYPGNTNIINNRVVGGHLGLSYNLTDNIEGRTMLTYTLNYGDLQRNSPFSPSKSQFYSLQEFFWLAEESRWKFNLSLGLDRGQLSNNFGVMLGCSYKLF